MTTEWKARRSFRWICWKRYGERGRECVWKTERFAWDEKVCEMAESQADGERTSPRREQCILYGIVYTYKIRRATMRTIQFTRMMRMNLQIFSMAFYRDTHYVYCTCAVCACIQNKFYYLHVQMIYFFLRQTASRKNSLSDVYLFLLGAIFGVTHIRKLFMDFKQFQPIEG